MILQILISFYESCYEINKKCSQKYSHNTIFQSETIPERKKLVKACHIDNVQEYRKSGLGFFNRSKVIRQVSVENII